MTLQTIPGGLWIPDAPRSEAGVGFSSLLIDAAAEKVAVIFAPPKVGTLEQFEFRTAAVAQIPANGVKCSWQGVSLANGDPDGVVGQFRVATIGGANLWIAPGAITHDGTAGGFKRSITQADLDAGLLLAAVIEFQNFIAGDSVAISTYVIHNSSGLSLRAYPDHFTAAWAKQTPSGHAPNIAIKYDDGSYVYVAGTIAYATIATPAFNSGSTPNERALYFSVPFPCKIVGAWFRVAVVTNADFVVTLYDSNGTSVLATVAVDASALGGAGQTGLYVPFPSSPAILANTAYRVAIKPTTANNVTLLEFTVNAAAIMDAFEGGQNFQASERTGAGAWSQTATRRPIVGLLVNAFDDGSNLAQVVADVAQIKADLPTRITKNVAFAGRFPFFMAKDIDHVTAATGLTVTAQRSLDGGVTFANCANAVVEAGAGWYYIDGFAAGDVNADAVALRLSAPTALTRNLTILTQPT